MSGALETLRQAVAAALNAGGVNAVAAMEPEARRRWDGPVAAVSLAGVECGPGGFQHYLGAWKNPDTGLEEEVYGRKAQFTLDLDLYAPRSGGEGACRDALARAADQVNKEKALTGQMPSQKVVAEGLSVRQTEALAKRLARDREEMEDSGGEKPSDPMKLYRDAAAKELSARWGRKVSITMGPKKGRLEFEFYNDEDLTALLDRLEETLKGGSPL